MDGDETSGHIWAFMLFCVCGFFHLIIIFFFNFKVKKHDAQPGTTVEQRPSTDNTKLDYIPNSTLLRIGPWSKVEHYTGSVIWDVLHVCSVSKGKAFAS